MAELERAITVIVRWSNGREVQMETMRRARCELPVGAMAMLGRIAATGPVHPSELAAYYGVDNSTITPQLQRLERAGLISREQDPRDRRAALLHVTREGTRLRKRLHQARRAMLEELLGRWSADDRQAVSHACSRLAESIEVAVLS
ncbi:MAG: MarR family winged helix-turn-helix transcriptional regulator [Candidatus Dormibacteria bacterium]